MSPKRKSSSRNHITGALLGLLVLTSVNLFADQSDPRLNTLFDTLQQANNPQNARMVERDIWSIWHETPDDTASQMMRNARQALDGGDYPTAIDFLNRLLEYVPGYAEAWNQRAIVLYLAEDYSGPLRDIDQTLRLEPRHFGALSGRGQVYLQLDELEFAAAAFEQALVINPWMMNIRQQLEMVRAALSAKPQAI